MSFDRLKPAFDAGVPGVAWVLRFDEEGRAEPGDAEDVAKLGAPGEGFVWLHLDLSNVQVHALIAKLAALGEEGRKTLAGPIERQFIEHSGNLVRGAFFDHQRDISGRLPEIDYLRFVFGEQFLVSARERPLDAVETTRMALGAGRLAASPLELFETIVSRLCDELGRMIYELAAALDRVEERILTDGRHFEDRTLGPTRRAALRLAREVNGLRSPLLRLEATVDEEEDEELKQVGTRLARRVDILSHDLSEVQDRGRVLQDEINAIASLVTNDRLYILTVVTTVLLPATFVTGFFGMNTKNLPFTDTEHGTAYAAAFCIGAAALALFIFRRLGLTRPHGA
ncbi:MAG TPA: CorA family divalent cation transporter [Methylocystis sp.]|nr:CorA family divalent cation transporter [Methylocystis sp.]